MKPTAYWFVGCEHTFGESYQPRPKAEIRKITAGSGAAKTKRKKRGSMGKEELDKMYVDHNSENGICDTERSVIHPDYARNFICDFILGKKQQYTVQTLF